jgi:hypothetical protein
LGVLGVFFFFFFFFFFFNPRDNSRWADPVKLTQSVSPKVNTQRDMKNKGILRLSLGYRLVRAYLLLHQIS